MKGFTLIESVLAIAIIGVGIIGFFLAFSGLMSSALLVDQTVIATSLAGETMEEIIAQRDCSQPGCGYAATLTSINTNNDYDKNPVPGFTAYIIDTAALEVDADNDNNTDDFLDASPGSGYARVTVNVSWNNGAESIEIVTIMADY